MNLAYISHLGPLFGCMVWQWVNDGLVSIHGNRGECKDWRVHAQRLEKPGYEITLNSLKHFLPKAQIASHKMQHQRKETIFWLSFYTCSCRMVFYFCWLLHFSLSIGGFLGVPFYLRSFVPLDRYGNCLSTILTFQKHCRSCHQQPTLKNGQNGHMKSGKFHLCRRAAWKEENYFDSIS